MRNGIAEPVHTKDTENIKIAYGLPSSLILVSFHCLNPAGTVLADLLSTLSTMIRVEFALSTMIKRMI